MPKLVCVKCQRELSPVKNGVSCVDMFHIPPEPYQIYEADKRLAHLPRVKIAERMGMKWTALEWVIRWKNQKG